MDAEIPTDKFIEYMTMDFPSFKITKCNLSYPTSEFITSFYTLLIEAITELSNVGQLCSLTEEQLTLLNANQSEGTSFIQHVYSRNVHHVVKYIFSRLNISVPEFYYSDILIPELSPRRAYLFMCLMLHSFYTAVTFSEDLDEGIAGCEEKCRRLQVARDMKAQLLEQLQILEDKKAEHYESVRAAKANALKISVTNKENEFILKDLHSSLGELEDDFRKAEEREYALNEELIKLENEIKANENLIVLNPEEAAEALAKNEEKKIECKNKMKRHEEEVRLASHKISVYDKIAEYQEIITDIISPGDSRSPDFTMKDFKELQNYMNSLNVKLSAIKSTDCGLSSRFLEKELLVPKLKNELAQNESEEAGIMCRREERVRMYNEYMENKEKIYTQRSIIMKKEAQEAEEIKAQLAIMEEKCAELEGKIKAVNQLAKERYASCANDIKNALGLVQKALTS